MQNPDGTPIWFELTTPDPAKARTFYADTVGWRIAAPDMADHADYLVATAPDGEGVAGIMAPPPGTPGVPGVPGWSIYFGVSDVDATAARITDRGGGIAFGPADIPGVGRFAVAHDPQGVTFNVMRGNSPEPSTAFRPGPGNIGHGVWIELATPDPDGAFAFYGALFGWSKAGAMEMPALSDAAGGVEGGEMGEYAFIGTGGEERPGAIMPSTTTNTQPGWSTYFHVRDIDVAVGAAEAAGGTLVQGPDQIPGGDYSAKLVDAGGAAFGLVGPRH